MEFQNNLSLESKKNENNIKSFSLSDKNDNKTEIFSYKMPHLNDLLIDNQLTLHSDNHHFISKEYEKNNDQNNEYFSHIDINDNIYHKNNKNKNDNIQTFTSSLNPSRTPDILPLEIFQLLESQAYFIRGIQFKELIARTAHAIVHNISTPLSYSLPAIMTSTSQPSTYQSNTDTLQHPHTSTWIGIKKNIDYAEILWGDSEARSKILALRNATSANPQRADELISSSSSVIGNDLPDGCKERGRARSVGKGRKLIRSSSKNGTSGTGPIRVSPSGVSRNRLTTRSKSDGKMDNENDTYLFEDQKGRRVRTSISKDHIEDFITDENDMRIMKDSSCKNNYMKSKNENLLILSALPKNIKNIIEDGKGAYNDVWFTSHPLESLPLSITESMKSISEPNKQGIILNNEKQLMWHMDLIRDSDEQRMTRYESFLSSKRNPDIDDQIKTRPQNLIRPYSSNLQQKLSRKQKNIISNDYYKDKGRQSNK